MSAAETWPDGTPKRKSGFDPKVWSGEKPLAKPVDRPLEVGDYVELRYPGQDKAGPPISRGLIIDVFPNDDGEQVFSLLTESWAHEGQPVFGTSGPWAADLVDRRSIVEANAWQTSTFVAKLLAFVAQKHMNGSSWYPWEFQIIGAGLRLVRSAA